MSRINQFMHKTTRISSKCTNNLQASLCILLPPFARKVVIKSDSIDPNVIITALFKAAKTFGELHLGDNNYQSSATSAVEDIAQSLFAAKKGLIKEMRVCILSDNGEILSFSN